MPYENPFPPEAGPYREVPVDQRVVVDFSFPGRCEKSEDTRHHWMKMADGVQSSEVFECKFCGEVIVD